MRMNVLSWSRWTGIVVKEFIQLKRDRLTFGMIVGIPVIQLLLFGFAINSDPKSLPTAVLSQDNSVYARSIVAGLQTSGYFRVVRQIGTEAELEDMLAQGNVQFVVTIPQNFERELVRAARPVLLVEADATDPSATGNALAALNQIVEAALARDLRGVMGDVAAAATPGDIVKSGVRELIRRRPCWVDSSV